MTYLEKTWISFPNLTTPVNATGLNEWEQRIADGFTDLQTQLDTLDNSRPTLNVVTDFGADNTGVTNAATAINNAINALPSSGGTVYLPRGTYLLTANVVLKSYVTLLGAGMDLTTMKAGPALNLTGANWITHTGFNTSPVTRITLRDITFDGNISARGASVGDPGAGANISFHGVNNSTKSTYISLERCRIQNYPGIGFAHQLCDNGRIIGCEAFNGTRDSFHVANAANSWLIHGNRVTSCGDDMIVFHGSQATATQSTAVVISNNICDTSIRDSYGIQVTGTHSAVITGNRVNNAWQCGISVQCIEDLPSSRVVIANNMVTNSGQTGTGAGDGIFINNGKQNYYTDDVTIPTKGLVDQIVISGNVIRNSKGAGIYMNGHGSSDPVRDVSISGNVIWQAVTGIQLVGTIYDTVISGNRVITTTGLSWPSVSGIGVLVANNSFKGCTTMFGGTQGANNKRHANLNTIGGLDHGDTT